VSWSGPVRTSHPTEPTATWNGRGKRKGNESGKKAYTLTDPVNRRHPETAIPGEEWASIRKDYPQRGFNVKKIRSLVLRDRMDRGPASTKNTRGGGRKTISAGRVWPGRREPMLRFLSKHRTEGRGVTNRWRTGTLPIYA